MHRLSRHAGRTSYRSGTWTPSISIQQGVIVACPQCGQKNRLAYERLGRHRALSGVQDDLCRRRHAPIEVDSSAHFDALIADSSLPVVVDFWAPWCGPCRMVAPELQKVAARQAGKLLVVKVNTDELSDLGQRFGIRSIPTMAVFAGGREVGRTSGARPANDIEAFVEQATPKVRTRTLTKCRSRSREELESLRPLGLCTSVFDVLTF